MAPPRGTLKSSGSGRAISRFLSAPLARRRGSFVSAASTRNLFRRSGTWSGPLRGFLFGLAPDGVFRASALALGAVGFYPAFSPLPPGLADRRRFVFCGTIRRKGLAALPPACVQSRNSGKGYAASRPMEFGLSSPGRSRRRPSTLPEPSTAYRGTDRMQARGFRSLQPVSLCVGFRGWTSQ